MISQFIIQVLRLSALNFLNIIQVTLPQISYAAIMIIPVVLVGYDISYKNGFIWVGIFPCPLQL